MPARLTNFGQNVGIEPLVLVTPTDTQQVLTCLDTYRDRQIRVLGSLHSWSEAAAPDDVALDLRHLNQISPPSIGAVGEIHVDVGAGCTVDRLLDFLGQHGGYTLPVYGVVGKQTIAGAISTATHGSGRPSLSHYVVAATVAAYSGDKKTDAARIFQWDSGDQLRAIRCGLGCAGVVLGVRLQVEPDFQIEERTQWFDRLDALLAEARDHPRHQFYLIPWSWKWYAQLRRPVPSASGWMQKVVAHVLRLFRLVFIDVLLNGTIRVLTASSRTLRHIPWLFRRLFPLLARSGMRVIDHSRQLLTMRHELFRHVECELFVPAEHLPRAAALVEWALRCCGGEEHPPGEDVVRDTFGPDAMVEIHALRHLYLHDYPVTFRRVLRDDTLISMTSGAVEEWYAISLITYQRDLVPFLRLTRFLAKVMARTIGARPHWGKICPLGTDELAVLYPELARFRQHCTSVDRSQVFVNDFARTALGFERVAPAPEPVARRPGDHGSSLPV